jgi:putative two-component system response regulator
MPNAETHAPVVLVVDDDESTRLLLGELLAAQGYEVRAAANGDEALDLLARHPVSLVLLDVMMPRRSGFAVCRILKSDPQTRLIPVVLLTGLADAEDRIQGIECGADDFLSKPFRKEELLARARSLVRLKQFTDELESAETVLSSLALSIEAKDPYTEGHCHRLSQFSVTLAERLGLPEEQRVALRRGGIVHDIGKVVVPERVLLKPGPLTAEERKVMEQHPVVGERICAPLRSFRLVLPIIRHHHEKMDGSGYPDGLKRNTIPLSARILQTVDVYDALTTDRPYRKALSPQEALKTLREEVRRGWWDPDVVSEFEGLVNGAGLKLRGLP